MLPLPYLLATCIPISLNFLAAIIEIIALITCSKICETAVGIIVLSPWKYPLITPAIQTTKTVGANTLSAGAQDGYPAKSAIKSANINVINAIDPPTTKANAKETLRTFTQSSYFLAVTFAETIFEIAKGKLTDEINNKIL